MSTSPVPDTPVVRVGQCAGCAFCPGSPANLSPMTLIKAKLCVLTSTPFLCHANMGANGEPIPGTPKMLCRGFVDALDARLRLGKQEPEWRQELYLAMLDVIDEINERPDLNDKPEEQIALCNQRIGAVLRHEGIAEVRSV